MSTIARDSDYSTPVEVGRRDEEYPFEALGDLSAVVLSRTFKQIPDNYREDRASGRFAPGAVSDSEIPDAYLMATGKPTVTATGLFQFSRQFARVPAAQVSYGSRVITKPTAASVGGATGAAYGFVSAVSGGSLLGQYALFSGYVFAPNSKVYGPEVVTTSANSGGNTRITFSSPHGLTGTEYIASKYDVIGYSYGIVAPTTGWSVVDSTTIDLLGVNLGGYGRAVAKYLRDYTPGTARVGTRNTQSFYLPGVTSGIFSPADIPMPSVLVNDAAFLASVIANTSGYITYDASELTRWRDWPIYTQTLTAINMSNV